MKLTRRGFIGLSVAAAAFPAARLLASNEETSAVGEVSEAPLPSIETGGLIRPPGAQDERLFRARCISCGVCSSICHTMKYDAIAVSPFPSQFWKGGGMRDFGTPYIKDMRDFPCGLCMECPGRCPTGALMPVEKEKVRMGMALIDFSLCFGWNGDVCLSCSKACPLGGKVFDFFNGQWGNQPYINESCVGCGLCVKYCPLGGSAIKVITIKSYESVKAAYNSQFKGLLDMSIEERYNIVYGQNLPLIMARGRMVEREYR